MQTHPNDKKPKKPPNAGMFQPGNSAAKKTNGPRGRFITQHLIRALHSEMKDFDPKHPNKKKAKVVVYFVDKLIQLALDGDTTAIKLVMDRIEGTAISTVNFREIPDGEETPEVVAAMKLTQEKIASMTPDERIALYRNSLTEAGRTLGSA